MDDLAETIKRLIEWTGRPMSVRDIVRLLDAEDFWDEEWVAKLLQRGKARVVQDALRREGVDGLPTYARVAPASEEERKNPKYEQLAFLQEDDWKFNIDVRAELVEADWEKLVRFVDAFESRFGYRYMPDALRRLCELHYGDETHEDGWRGR